MEKSAKTRKRQPKTSYPLFSNIPDKWIKRLNQNPVPTQEEIKQAFCFDIGFCVGRGMDHQALYLDKAGKFKKTIDSCAIDGLIKGLDFVRTGAIAY